MDNHDVVNLIKLFVFNTILDVGIHEGQREPIGPQLRWFVIVLETVNIVSLKKRCGR